MFFAPMYMQDGYYTSPNMRSLLTACPNLGRLDMVCIPMDEADHPDTADTHSQLHTLHLFKSSAVLPMPNLPSLTALLLDWCQGSGVDQVQHAVNPVASQLTRLRINCHTVDVAALTPCVPGLKHNLQRLELPSTELTDGIFKLLPELCCVEFWQLSLSCSVADVDCSWRELRLATIEQSSLRQLAWLPLARAGRKTPGLQRLELAGINCKYLFGDRDALVAAVRSSTCRLAPVQVAGEQQQRRVVLSGEQDDLELALPLLACFEPDSIFNFGLCTGWEDISPTVLTALGSLFAIDGAASLARCHTLEISFGRWANKVACAALLPMLMATPVTTVVFLSSMTAEQLAAICCPQSLAAVTRRIMLRVRCVPFGLQQAQEAIAAAGKAELLSLEEHRLLA
jgi:hypothetical protein